jgi:hypothetical protein
MSQEVVQYGSVGAIIASVMALIVGPIVKSMIEQNRRSLEILQESLAQNADTIKQLKEMEAGSVLSRQALAETQTEILASLRSLERTLASK